MAEIKPLLVWSEAFLLGIPQLDDDHRKLFDFINRLNALAADKKSDAEFDGEFAALHTHALQHFAREEKLLPSAATPTGADTRRAAEAFFDRIAADAKTGERRISHPMSLEYLHRWVLDHILVDNTSARDKMIADGAGPAHVEAKSEHLSRLRIGQRIWIMAAVPLLVLALSEVEIGYDKLTLARGLDRIVALSHTTKLVGNLVHALQKERGASAGFLNSKGREFGADLAQFRKDVNADADAFRAAASEDATADLRAQIVAANDALGRLEALRHHVDTFSVAAADEVASYTRMNHALLSVVDGIAAMSPDEKLGREISGFSVFLRGKDLAGIERARGAAGFGGGGFSHSLYHDFVVIGAEQNVYFALASGMLSPVGRGIVATALNSTTERRLAEYRDVATSAQGDGDLKGIRGADWFAASTAYIDNLKSAETALAAQIEADASAKAAAARSTATTVIGSLAALVLAICAVVVFIIRSITRPLDGLRQAVVDLGQGHTTRPIRGQTRQDEIGLIARAVHKFRQNLIRADFASADDAIEASVTIERAKARQRITDAFRSDVDVFLHTLSHAADSLHDAAVGMEQSSSQSHRQAVHVSDAAVEASQSVDSVAAASEQLSSSIGEIARQVARSADVSRNVADSSEMAQTAMGSLADSAVKIGDIVGMINDIASQTNLLALNATIEAARAGNAGKGFAVVAAEVKVLSGQTERATREIAAQVGAVQSATRKVVEAIDIVVSNIGEMSEIAAMIAGAIEEQRAATEEISASVSHAAEGTRNVTSNISGVAEANDRIDDMSKTVSGAAEKVSAQTQALKDQVEAYLREVATA